MSEADREALITLTETNLAIANAWITLWFQMAQSAKPEDWDLSPYQCWTKGLKFWGMWPPTTTPVST